MIAAWLTTALTGLVSAFFPITPVEPYLVALAAATSYNPVGLGIAAAVGQTAGKTVLFLGARGALRSARLRGWIEAAERRREQRRAKQPTEATFGESSGTATATAVRGRIRTAAAPVVVAGRKLLALLDRPALAAPILLLSATTGFPPLMAASIYAAGTRISVPVFIAACLLGRSIRFIAIACAPALVL
ncbi:MAG TPA: hypothetical protein VHG10_14670 [Glycomyces sp.]|nr:hypothetical protein [Glycomyces sp.]